MSEELNEGNENMGGAPVENGGGGAPASGGAAATEKWTDGLPEDLRGSSVLQKYGSQEAALRALVSAQGLIGRKGLAAPAEGASAEEVAAYRAARRCGIKEPGDYKEPSEWNAENLAAVGLGGKAVENMRKAAFEMGLDADGYRAFVNATAGNLKAQREAAAQAMSAHADELRTMFRAEWGEQYEQKLADGRALMEDLGFFDAAEASGLTGNPNFIRFIDEAVRRVKSEGGLPKITGRGGSSAETIKALTESGALTDFRNKAAQERALEAYREEISRLAAQGAANHGRITL